MKNLINITLIVLGKLKEKYLTMACDEYIKRHDEIWPEMTEMLNESGIHNYSIWNVGDELFVFVLQFLIAYRSRLHGLFHLGTTIY